MLCARDLLRAGEWAGCPADSVRLDFDGRQRRRIALTGTGGTAFLLDLPRVMGLQDGDALRLEDGRLVAVVAAPEPLLEVRARSPQHLVRIAWHLGNRHLPTAIEERRLLIRYDHVIAEMLETLGASTTPVTEPFRPEGGAYGLGTTLAHDHGHGHSHGHGHEHPHHHVAPRTGTGGDG
jgi:urease accessory protein